MREIKFRAWVKNEDLFGIKTKEKYPKGHMFIGFGLSDIDKGYDEANAWCENDRWEEPDFEKAVIMQFTGLKDKNGKEIYEFDYLGDYCVFWGSGKYILQNISTGDILDCNEENTNQKEITGNRFEHPREHKAMETDL